MSTEPDFITIAEAAQLVAALDPQLNAFITVTPELALQQAQTAEFDIVAGRYRGPMHGIPFGLKDLYATAGILTSGHSRVCIDHIPGKDAAVTEKLYAAGAVLLGTLATTEFAHGGPSFDAPWPPARNPSNPEHFTGGSSSGSGAAVAAGLALGVFRQLGASVEETRMRPLQEYLDVKATIAETEIFCVHQKDLIARPGDFGMHFLAQTLAGCLFEASDYVQAQRERRLMLAEMEPLYGKYDVLVTASSGPAPRFEVLGQPDVHELFNNIGYEPTGTTPEQLAAIIKSETAAWAKVIKDAGIKAE